MTEHIYAHEHPESDSRRDGGFTLWFTGLSGAGKSTIAHLVWPELERRGHVVEYLDVGAAPLELRGERVADRRLARTGEPGQPDCEPRVRLGRHGPDWYQRQCRGGLRTRLLIPGDALDRAGAWAWRVRSGCPARLGLVGRGRVEERKHGARGVAQVLDE